MVRRYLASDAAMAPLNENSRITPESGRSPYTSTIFSSQETVINRSLESKRSDNDAIDPFYANLISKDWRHIFPSTAAGSVPPHPWQDAD